MITEMKPKLGVVEHLREAGYRVTERPAADAETVFRRLNKQVNHDTTIPRDAVEKCFRAADYGRLPTPEAIDEAMRHLQILADSANTPKTFVSGGRDSSD
jgi:hypothetical protein